MKKGIRIKFTLDGKPRQVVFNSEPVEFGPVESGDAWHLGAIRPAPDRRGYSLTAAYAHVVRGIQLWTDEMDVKGQESLLHQLGRGMGWLRMVEVHVSERDVMEREWVVVPSRDFHLFGHAAAKAMQSMLVDGTFYSQMRDKYPYCNVLSEITQAYRSLITREEAELLTALCQLPDWLFHDLNPYDD